MVLENELDGSLHMGTRVLSCLSWTLLFQLADWNRNKKICPASKGKWKGRGEGILTYGRLFSKKKRRGLTQGIKSIRRSSYFF